MTQWANCIPAHDSPSLLLFLGLWNIPLLDTNGGPATRMEGLYFEVHSCGQVPGWSLALVKGALI